MKKRLTKIMRSMSEWTKEINTLAAVEEPTESQITSLRELREKSIKGHDEYQAALDAEGDTEHRDVNVSAEERERRELRGKARLSSYMRAAINGKILDGAEAECSAAYECPGAVPLEVFHAEEREREERAETPAPSTADQTLASIVPAIFQRSAASWLGIDMPSVGVGDAGYPVLSTNVTGGPKAAGAAAAETPGAFTVTTAQPRRITGSFRFRREDAARLSGMEEALRQNLSAVLSNEVDNQALNGSGVGDGTINGLLNILTDPSSPGSGVETYDRFAAAFLSHIDGVFAVDRAGVRMLMGAATYRLAGTLYRASTGDVSALDHLSLRYGGVRLSNRIAAPASHIQQAIVRRSNPAGDRVAVMPVWQGLELIRDNITDAAKGEIAVTGLMLVGDVVRLRPDAFVQDSFRVSS